MKDWIVLLIIVAAFLLAVVEPIVSKITHPESQRLDNPVID